MFACGRHIPSEEQQKIRAELDRIIVTSLREHADSDRCRPRFPDKAYRLADKLDLGLREKGRLLGMTGPGVYGHLKGLGLRPKSHISEIKLSERHDRCLEALAAMRKRTYDELVAEFGEINVELKKADLPSSSKVRLKDRRCVIAFLVCDSFVEMGRLLGVSGPGAKGRASLIGLCDEDFEGKMGSKKREKRIMTVKEALAYFGQRSREELDNDLGDIIKRHEEGQYNGTGRTELPDDAYVIGSLIFRSCWKMSCRLGVNHQVARNRLNEIGLGEKFKRKRRGEPEQRIPITGYFGVSRAQIVPLQSALRGSAAIACPTPFYRSGRDIVAEKRTSRKRLFAG